MHAAIGKDKTLHVSNGSAKFNVGGMGEISVPTNRAYKECVRRFDTRLTDEFRTTVVHHETLAIVEGVGRLDTKQKARGLQWCRSTSQTKGKFVHRDHRATINILNLMLRKRPEATCWSNKVKFKNESDVGYPDEENRRRGIGNGSKGGFPDAKSMMWERRTHGSRVLGNAHAFS
mmetsp:Transcript_11547/g.71002  ORF Transcript_11547/g.71002 Transcript_11547/m.71002 type:complete len:175 (-) Transcript_11547:2335-2859(-)